MESWRGNVVSCDGCPNPPTANALGSSWHAGTHIIHTLDGDDPGEGGGTTSSAAETSSTSQQPTSASSAKPPAKTTASATSSAPPAKTSKADGDDGDDGDSDDEDSGKGKGKGGGKVRRSSYVKASSPVDSILTLPHLVGGRGICLHVEVKKQSQARRRPTRSQPKEMMKTMQVSTILQLPRR